jgi:hypothetical protein
MGDGPDDIMKERRMKKTILATVVLAFVALVVALLAHAGSDRKVQPINPQPKVRPAIKATDRSSPQRAPLTDSRQGYRLVTDVIDGFGGKSESSNYRISVNSGGQPSPPGISESTNWGMKAGFVHASGIRHGDANADGAVGLGDAIYILNYLFKGGPDPCPMEAGDANCDGVVNLGDAIYILNYLFKGGPSPGC